MLPKILIIVLLLLIGLSLASGLFFLVCDQGHSKNVVKSLSWRVGLSIGLFILLILLFFWGGVEPRAV
jgi:hypothetical protein